MTEQGTYRVDKCTICGVPIAIHSSDEGTCFATPLYVDARDRVVLAEELEREHAEVVRLRGILDTLRGAPSSRQLTTLRNHFENELATAEQQRDSARKWAARWKRLARWCWVSDREGTRERSQAIAELDTLRQQNEVLTGQIEKLEAAP